MAVIALMMTISTSAQFYIYFSDGTVAKVDSISMIAPEEPNPGTPDTPAEPETPSAGVGVFSVSADKQVTFSKGNLQYTQSTNTWSFASAQWEMLGTDNVTNGALADKVDLFGWSTSANNFGVSVSKSSSDYSGSFVDWGTNTIGDDAPNTWRTLNYSEWCYLRYDRANADSLCGIAQINGINGLILLPDNWNSVEGIAFKFGFNDKWTENYADYQTFTTEQWSKLESAGAIFLPVTGFRNITSISSIYDHGGYWSASCYDNQDAYYFALNSRGAVMGNYDARYGGRGVRLVKDVQLDTIENSHEYVDLGLSVKWATCNVGASKPEEYGDYFAWGETEPKDYYGWSTYKWCDGTYNILTKYNNSSSDGTVDNKTQLELSDDAARANWGGNWRMPTDTELTELRENCTWTQTTQEGVNGYKVTSKKNGNTIFLPAAGYRNNSSLNYAGSRGYYRSSSLNTDAPDYAFELIFRSDRVDRGSYSRNYGLPVRPVCQ